MTVNRSSGRNKKIRVNKKKKSINQSTHEKQKQKKYMLKMRTMTLVAKKPWLHAEEADHIQINTKSVKRKFFFKKKNFILIHLSLKWLIKLTRFK